MVTEKEIKIRKVKGMIIHPLDPKTYAEVMTGLNNTLSGYSSQTAARALKEGVICFRISHQREVRCKTLTGRDGFTVEIRQIEPF